MPMTIGAVLLFSMVIPTVVLGETLFLNDLSPEEVQLRLSEQSLDLNYAKFLGERPLPADAVSSFEQSRIAEHPEDYLQQSYQANQFHGQDGLGRAMFGYTDWNQGRLEARNANGEVRGSYQYMDAFGDNVVVNYWSDSLGFHQTDNRKVEVLESVTDTPEVQAAKLAHQRAWDAAAKAAQENPDPMSDIYNSNANRLDEERSEREQAQQIIASQQVLNRYPSPNAFSGTGSSKSSDIELDKDTVLVQSAESRQSNQYQRARNDDSSASASENDEQQVEGASGRPPRGFFYTFDYPVQVVVDNPETRSAPIPPPVTPEPIIRIAPIPESKPRTPIVVPVDPFQRIAAIAAPEIRPRISVTTAAPEILAEPDQFKMVPLRILDSQKFKRSDKNSRRRQVAMQNRFQRMNRVGARSADSKTTLASPIDSTPIHTITILKQEPVDAQRPIAAQTGPQSNRILELRRLAGDSAETVDAVHDAQIHPKQRV